MKVEIADPYENAEAIAFAARDFVSRMDCKSFFPENDEDFAVSLSKVVLAEYVDIIMAKDDFGLAVGFLGMAYVPHIWNQDMLHAEEIFWWTATNAPKMTAMRLLKFAMKHSKERGAGMVTFVKLTSSPDKVSDVYRRMGLKEIETAYSGLI